MKAETKERQTISYEKPTITTYGTVRELTFGNGSSSKSDVGYPTTCTIGPFQGPPPSHGVNCF